MTTNHPQDISIDKSLDRSSDWEFDAFGHRRASKKRGCKYCADKSSVIDYKDPQELKYFISDRGKIVPSRISGNCAWHQRKVRCAIKRARHIALLPFTTTQA